jgi:hypothetical protein
MEGHIMYYLYLYKNAWAFAIFMTYLLKPLKFVYIDSEMLFDDKEDGLAEFILLLYSENRPAPNKQPCLRFKAKEEALNFIEEHGATRKAGSFDVFFRGKIA